MAANTKLNQRARKQPVTVQSVAAKNNLNVGISANGNVQFKKDSLQHLYEIVVSSLFGKDTYYQSANTLVNNLIKETHNVVAMDQLDFIANLAVYARTDMNIRTIPIVLVVQFAKELRVQHKSYPLMRRLVCDVIQRADQINDMYAYALTVFGDKKAIPMAIKRGVGDAFNKFDEYHFGKYNRDASIKFKDVLRIVHPSATKAGQGEIFQKIMEDRLETPYTWETELSRNGQIPIEERLSKDKLWTQLIESGKVGYMAQLRNMRNIVEANVPPGVITTVADLISDRNQVLISKQLPFDFVEAYKIVASINSKLATAVSKAIDISCCNIPKLGDNVWIVIDYSGSMGGDTAPAINNATLLAAGLIKASDTSANLAITLFGSDAETIHGIDTNNSVMGIQKELLRYRRGNIAGSTNFCRALQELNSLRFKPDTIVVLTDGEVDHFPYSYMADVSKDKSIVKLTVNLNAAPTTPMIRADGWYALAGWSTAMFKFIPAMRNSLSVTEVLSCSYMGLKSFKPRVVDQV